MIQQPYLTPMPTKQRTYSNCLVKGQANQPIIAEQSLPQLANCQPISLAEIKHAELLKRVESKYVMPASDLPDLLSVLKASYYVLEIKGVRLNRYRTLYFDTADFQMYRQHHAGASNRFKIRARSYVESNSSFLEVKQKDNRKHVIKNRIKTKHLMTDLNGRSAMFVEEVSPYDLDELFPRLWNSYQRITLVSKTSKERVTLDSNLCFEWGDSQMNLSDIVIAEVKQERFSQASEFIQLMRKSHIRTTGFSKYCMGASLLYPHLKHNRFKSKHLQLAKLRQGEGHGTH